jgi:hypothetical protein
MMVYLLKMVDLSMAIAVNVISPDGKPALEIPGFLKSSRNWMKPIC